MHRSAFLGSFTSYGETLVVSLSLISHYVLTQRLTEEEVEKRKSFYRRWNDYFSPPTLTKTNLSELSSFGPFRPF